MPISAACITHCCRECTPALASSASISSPSLEGFRATHPECKVISHPECSFEVCAAWTSGCRSAAASGRRSGPSWKRSQPAAGFLDGPVDVGAVKIGQLETDDGFGQLPAVGAVEHQRRRHAGFFGGGKCAHGRGAAGEVDERRCAVHVHLADERGRGPARPPRRRCRPGLSRHYSQHITVDTRQGLTKMPSSRRFEFQLAGAL